MLFGIGFALLARERIRADGPFAAPSFQLVVLHAAAVVAPIALYFYAVHPAWALMYWVDPAKISVLAVLPLVALHVLLVVAGWYVAGLFIRRRQHAIALYIGGGLVVTLLVLVIAGSGRLATAADYLGWRLHQGTSLFAVQLGWAFVVSLLALFGSAIYVAIELGRDGRRVRSR